MKRSIMGVIIVILVGLGVVGVLNIKGQSQLEVKPGPRILKPGEAEGFNPQLEPPGQLRDGQLGIIKTKGKEKEWLRLGILKDGKLVPVRLEEEELVPDPEAEGEKSGLLQIIRISPLGVTRKGNVIDQSKGSVLGVIETNGKVLLLGAKQGDQVVPLKMQANNKLRGLPGSKAGVIGDCGEPAEVMVNINNNHRPVEVNAKGIIIIGN
ncbi:MAG: hypothetical protein AB1797_10105 [bacterium]